jgi:hypothetical protein
MITLPKPTVTKRKNPSWRTIANHYRDGLQQVFGCGDAELDEYLVKALKKDVHRSSEAPGQWSPSSVLEIYCESGIPNATDINEFEWEGKYHCSYNSDKWYKVDQYVNQTLALEGYSARVYYEPYNSAVINIHWS